MIRYKLRCNKQHEFEAWFGSSAAYDRQAKRGLVTCPDCGSKKVEKALMAPPGLALISVSDRAWAAASTCHNGHCAGWSSLSAVAAWPRASWRAPDPELHNRKEGPGVRRLLLQDAE